MSLCKRVLLAAASCALAVSCNSERQLEDAGQISKPAARKVAPQTLREVLELLVGKDPVNAGWVLPLELMSTKVTAADPDDVNSLWAAVRSIEAVKLRSYDEGWRMIIPKAASGAQMTIFPGQPELMWKKFAEYTRRVSLQGDARDIRVLFQDLYQFGYSGRWTVSGQYSVSVPRMPLGEILLLLADVWDMDILVVEGRIIWEPRKRHRGRATMSVEPQG